MHFTTHGKISSWEFLKKRCFGGERFIAHGCVALRQTLLWKCYIMWNIHSCQMSGLSGRLKQTLCRLCLAVVSLFTNGKHTKQMRSRLPANEVCSREQQSVLKSTAQTRITHTLSIHTTAITHTHTPFQVDRAVGSSVSVNNAFN